MAAVLLTVLLAGGDEPFFWKGGPQDSLQDLKDRAAELLRQAREARAMGDLNRHHQLLGESAFIIGRISEAEGKWGDAQRHFETARRYGYRPPEPMIPLEPVPSSHFAPPPYGHQHPPTTYDPTVEDLPFHGGDLWEYYRYQPYPTTRNNGFHGLIHVPPMEGAATLPEYVSAYRFSIDFDSSNIKETDEGGTTRFNGRHHSEIFQFDYGSNSFVQTGFRVTAGELRASSGTRSTVFESGTQIVRRGARDYNLESLILRAKVHHDFLTFMETGFLLEVKFPLDARFDLLTADTIDVGLTLLATRHWGPLAFHVNVGGVAPFGNFEDIFRTFDGVQPFVTYGAGLVYSPGGFSLGLQFEGNTSPFEEISVLQDAVGQVVAHGSFEINENFYAHAAAGFGAGDLSADTYISAGFTFAY